MQPPPTFPLVVLLLSALLLLLRPLLALLRLLRRLIRLLRRLATLHSRPSRSPTYANPPPPLAPATSPRLLALLGSGGHTAELLTLLCDALPLLNVRPTLVYVATHSDLHSLARVDALRRSTPFLSRLATETACVPRAREVGQPALPSVVACARSFAALWAVFARHRPHLLLSNGPATGAVAAAVALGRELLFGERCHVVYVESLARVQTLSLSGRLLYFVADRFLVQWPELQERYPRAEYYGRLT